MAPSAKEDATGEINQTFTRLRTALRGEDTIKDRYE